jgi:hypothetical protein
MYNLCGRIRNICYDKIFKKINYRSTDSVRKDQAQFIIVIIKQVFESFYNNLCTSNSAFIHNTRFCVFNFKILKVQLHRTHYGFI